MLASVHWHLVLFSHLTLMIYSSEINYRLVEVPSLPYTPDFRRRTGPEKSHVLLNELPDCIHSFLICVNFI